ncbi:response regulator transcription factor [Jannaschia sp. R86511]|uniref:response regulator transcription factor n=1 Tax=Jannaschia sp. R86511 TaxID=3093853 RepID=UPI0036D3F523
MTRLLVVEDELALARALAITLRARGYEVALVGDGRAALDAVATTRPDVVLLDLGLPALDGMSVLQALRGWTDALPRTGRSKPNTGSRGAGEQGSRGWASGRATE